VSAALHTGIQLPGRHIGDGAPLFVIAEAGVNHNGDLGRALEMVDVAAEAGADAVKYQTFRAEHIITRRAPKAKYHIETTGPDEEQTWFDLLKTQELDRAAHEAIMERCAARGILFMSTPYDIPSIDLLDALDIALYKVASTDANNIPLLRYLAAKGRPIILSTAMCTLEEVAASVDAIRDEGVNQLVVMQCTGSYPAPVAQANLRAMSAIRERCQVAVGYSDHVPGDVAAIAAVAMGACAYEKHFTLDRALPGPDHRASLEPGELGQLIKGLRETETSLGDGIKRVMPCEEQNRERLRKRLVAASFIPAGTVITPAMLTTKRTGGAGAEPARLAEFVGRVTQRDIETDTAVDADALVNR
jgi:N,N'-diacetyllegionaminate synthase